VFSRGYNLRRHRETLHGEGGVRLAYACGACDLSFATQNQLKKHRKLAHRPLVKRGFSVRQSAHNGVLQALRLTFPRRIKTVAQAQRFFLPRVVREIKRGLSLMKRFKFCLILHVEMIQLSEDAETIKESMVFPFRTLQAEISHRSMIPRRLLDAMAFMRDSISEFLHRGSGWILSDIMTLDLELSKCHLLAGGGCGLHGMTNRKKTGMGLDLRRGFLPNPHAKKCVKRADREEREGKGKQDCFFLAVASHFVGEKPDAELRKFAREKFKGMREGPISVTSAGLFEKANAHLDLSISIVFWDEEDKGFIPLRPGGNIHAKNQVLLAMYYVYPPDLGGGNRRRRRRRRKGRRSEKGAEGGKGRQMAAEMHYVLVREPSRLFARKHKDGGEELYCNRRTRVCLQCFNTFVRKEAYENHAEWCHSSTGQRLLYPQKGSTVKFKNQQKALKSAYTLFYDFECLQLEPEEAGVEVCGCLSEERAFQAFLDASSEARRNSALLDELMRKTWERRRYALQRGCPHKTVTEKVHKGFSYHLVAVDRHGKVVRSKNYVGEDAASHFCDSVLKMAKWLGKKIKKVKKMKLTRKDRKLIASSPSTCVICKDNLSSPKRGRQQRIVRHHDHLNGQFIGLAHDYCNFLLRERPIIPAFAHNFSSYDSHLIVTEFAKRYKMKRIKRFDIVPYNSERIRIIQANNLIFLDSLAFVPASLQTLTDTLRESQHSFPLLRQWEENGERRELLLRKGVYPYRFATSIERLRNTTKLPPREEFYNDLGDESCAEEDYMHAQTVFDTFQCRNMLEYTQLYNASDVFQLAEVVTSFRNLIHDEFGLDLCQYWSLPMLSKDVFLHTSKCELDLMHDPEMCSMIRHNIRGGLSYINRRYFSARRRGRGRGKGKGPRSILYVDANNLYGSAMRMALPKGQFEWCTEGEKRKLKKGWKKHLSLKGKVGYILEVTLKYPKKLHKKHSSFPLAPQHLTIAESRLSPYARGALNTLHLRVSHRKRPVYTAKKLTSTFETRERYVLHGANLKFYLQQGLKLVTIHRAIKFRQEKFIKPYIDQCTRMRAAATTKERKDLFKLLCNSLFGKWIERQEGRMTASLARSENEAVRHTSHPLFKGAIILDKDFSVSIRNKSSVMLDSNYALGFAVLELSKLIMQKLFYRRIRPAMRNRVTVLMSDTDSFLMAVEKASPDEAMAALSSCTDTSNYDRSHPLFSEKRKAKPGFLKNESPSEEIARFAGIRSKSYAFQTRRQTDVRKAKGIHRRYLPKIAFEDYARCLKTIDRVEVTQRNIVSKKHRILLQRQDRVAFSSFDDKRYLLCSTHSVPYGSYLIKKSQRLGQCYFCRHPNLLI
jgi:hypothetical protein